MATRRLRWCAPAIAGMVLVGMVLVGCSSPDAATGEAASGADADRRGEVAERGAEVMPFDLEATTHRFTDTSRGGIQDVVADDPDDHEQVGLIRAHLAEEAARFAEGDFGDPAAIHGHDMPGLADLEERHDDIDVVYEETPEGARLTYTTDDPDLVRSLHAWFEAQVHDHGEHAEAG